MARTGRGPGSIAVPRRKGRRLVVPLLILACGLTLAGPSREGQPAVAGSAGPAPVAFDLKALDTSVNPCADFYQYACGTWLRNNPIPADEKDWGRARQLMERNLDILHGILEKAAQAAAPRGSNTQKIGDYYAACMDEKAADARGIEPLKGDLEQIAALKTTADLAPLIARLQSSGVNLVPGGTRSPSLLFGYGSEQDFKDATTVVAEIDQGGLGLPDRDYYLLDDPKSVETRGQYLDHVVKTFRLLGEPADAAAASAKGVLEIETSLARASLDKVKRRDPVNLYHRMSQHELAALAPSFAWGRYFEAIGAGPAQSLNVRVPEFFRALEALLKTAPLDRLKEYLRWQVARAWSPFLSTAFVSESFAFYDHALGGAKEIRPRFKRCVEFTDQGLGEALGQPYAEATLGPEGKARTLKMVQALEKALQDDITRLSWMTEATKKRALEKLRAITNKIGYPDRWRDYGGLDIVPGDFVGNTRRARAFESARWIAKIGKPVDPAEWRMTPPTVNAYYDPQLNNINFPAGILRPPFYDNGVDDAVNYGGIGMVIGHELTHGFDDQGRKFDGKGNLADWWTPKDAAEFEKRAACFVDEYSGFVAVSDVKLDGRLTLGENTADNGGMRIAHMALEAEAPAGKVDGFTPEQRLFIAQAQIWCTNMSDELARLLALTNPHSLPRYRVNGVVSNMPEFQAAFACPAGSPMVRDKPCRVW